VCCQLKWRLREGQGEAIYEIGVEDNGVLAGLSPAEMTASINTLRQMAHTLGATITVLRERWIDDNCSNNNANQKKVAEVLVGKVSSSGNIISYVWRWLPTPGHAGVRYSGPGFLAHGLTIRVD